MKEEADSEGRLSRTLRQTIRLLRNPDPGRSVWRLIVFTRHPEPGKTKTRLVPVLGPEGAAELHRRMTEHALRRVRQFLASHPVSFQVHYEGGGEERMRRWLGADLKGVPQAEGDLGRRMYLAFSAFSLDMINGVQYIEHCSLLWAAYTFPPSMNKGRGRHV